MCKKSLLDKLKSLSKEIPSSAAELKAKTQQKMSELKPNQHLNKLLEKTKQQFSEKQKNIKSMAQKSKQMLNTKQLNIKQSANKILESAEQIKKKVAESETLKNTKDKIGDGLQDIEGKIKEGFVSGKEGVAKKTAQILKSTSEILDKQKQVAQELSQKIKQKVTKKQETPPPKLQHTQKPQQASKASESFIDKIASMGVSKTQETPLPEAQPQKQLPPSEKEKSPYTFSAENLARRVLEQGRKIHENIFMNNVVKNTQNLFIKMLSNLYWRFLFGICLVAVIYVSPKLILSINQVYVDYQKLLLQQKQLEKKEQNSNYSTPNQTNVKPSMEKDKEFSLASRYS